MNTILQTIINKILKNYNLETDYLSYYMKTVFINRFEKKSIYYMTHYINIMIYQIILDANSSTDTLIPKFINYCDMKDI